MFFSLLSLSDESFEFDKNDFHRRSVEKLDELKMKICSTSGNIAAGKSTVMSKIVEKYSSNLVQVHREPVENWMNFRGFDLLQALYNDSCRWTFAFEMNALLSRIRNRRQIESCAINVHERSIFSCFHVFIRHDLTEKFINQTEYEILRDHFQYGLTNDIDLSKTFILYLDTSPKTCFQRILKRSRPSESSIDLNRLEKLNNFYEDFIEKFHLCPVKRIDGSQTPDKIFEQVEETFQEFFLSSRTNDESCPKQI